MEEAIQKILYGVKVCNENIIVLSQELEKIMEMLDSKVEEIGNNSLSL